MDEILVERFLKAPAGIKNHHAFQGGLLQHVVSLMGVADRVADQYPSLNRDLLVLGVLFHDLGKVDELSYERDMSYTTAGQLLGHVMLGVEILEPDFLSRRFYFDDERANAVLLGKACANNPWNQVQLPSLRESSFA